MTVIDSHDRLVLFGYGVFETLRLQGKLIETPRLHYARMKQGADILGLPLVDYEIWLEGIREFLRAGTQDDAAALRVTLSGGIPGEDSSPHFLYYRRSIPYTEKDHREGIAVCLLKNPRNELSPCTRIKSANYLENILGKKEAEMKGCLEGLWLNSQGFLAEGTMSNLFFVKKGVLFTPHLNCGCLPGTRREIVLDCAWQLGISVREGMFVSQDLFEAEEVFLTNALMGILPVKTFREGFGYSYKTLEPDGLTTRLKKAFQEYLNLPIHVVEI